MSNETNTGAPLAATLGERLEEKAHEGVGPAPEQVAAAVAGRPEERSAAHRDPRREAAAGRGGARRRARAPGDGHARVWGLLAGLGAFAAIAVARRLLRRR